MLKARNTIVKSLDNPKDAQWYAERKAKKEFAPRSEHTGAEGKDLPDLSDALTKAIEKIYGKPSD